MVSLPVTDTEGQSRQRLWQLLSPTLPIGAYAFSGGLEAAVQAGWVRRLEDVDAWLRGQLRHNLSVTDIPLLARLHAAWQADDDARLRHLSRRLRACRETAELASEDRHLGQALARLLRDLELPSAAPWVDRPDASWATLFSLALVAWRIPLADGAEAYLWSWCENQTAAAIKLVPLGQTDGQRLLLGLAQPVMQAATDGLQLRDEAIGGSAPGVAIASSQHETQYSRLFRS